jgi:hypothetical protein
MEGSSVNENQIMQHEKTIIFKCEIEIEEMEGIEMEG